MGVSVRAILMSFVMALCLLRGALAAEEVSCEGAGAEAESAWRLPSGLLSAIGRIESGRYDAAAGRVAPWPWTINAAGQGHYFESGTDAVAAVRDLQMQGVRSIDVGCFQINLFYHPGAFSTLESAFDARANADYAARFLTELYGRTGSWEAAIAAYHSATPAFGEPYRSRVMADWQGGGLRIAPGVPPLPLERAVARVDRVAVLVTAAALRVHVFTPMGFGAGAPADAFAPMHRVAAAARLPRVITPRG